MQKCIKALDSVKLYGALLVHYVIKCETFCSGATFALDAMIGAKKFA